MIRKPRPITSVATAVCAVALVVGGAGCGGDDSNQFREDYNAAVENLTEIKGAGQSNAAIAKELDEIADAADTARGELADLDPPEDARQEFDKLLAALDTGVDDLRSMATAAKSGDSAQAQTAAQELVKSGQQITAAENALKTAVDG